MQKERKANPTLADHTIDSLTIFLLRVAAAVAELIPVLKGKNSNF